MTDLRRHSCAPAVSPSYLQNAVGCRSCTEPLSKTGCGDRNNPVTLRQTSDISFAASTYTFPPMDTAKIFFWRARALYLGPAFGLSPHRNAVPVLCAALNGDFGVAMDPRARKSTYLSCRVALIPANTLHHLMIDTSPMAFLYVDARSDDFKRMRAQAGRFDGRLGRDLKDEMKYLTALKRLHAGASWSEIRSEIAVALNLHPATQVDSRVVACLKHLHRTPNESTELAQLAAQAGLSPSRFLHLFKQATGVPFRRYRLWARMGAAIRDVVGGRTLTDAALGAGFSSSAHFSAAYREMFGMTPSTLSAAAPEIVESTLNEGSASELPGARPSRK